MIEKVTMPQLGESVTEGTITTWLKQPGDEIRLYDPICEVATDKVNAEVPATVAGVLGEIIAEEGATVAVGEIICTIKKSGTAGEKEKKEISPPLVENTVPPSSESKNETSSAASTASEPMKKRYSPAVLRLAQEHDIDLQQMKGTGRGGRITRKDVLAFLEQKDTVTASDQHPHDVASETTPPVASPVGGDREIPLTPVRRTIAERMVQSKHEAPHAWMMVEADVTELVKLRQRVKDEFTQREGIRLTYLPFFIKAVVESLKQYPRLNAVWAGDKIIEKGEINISVAIAGEDALYVPVIHRADQLSLLGIAKALDTLIRKTEAGNLSLKDIEGGTFTVNNTGAFGSVASAPIINGSQAAIISMEAIVKRPVIINESIAIRDMVHFCLSIDHRILDGAMAGQFMQAVKQKMETYNADTPL